MATSKKSSGEMLFDPTSYAAVTLANLSVRQENGEVKKIRATCGRGYETPLSTYDPDTQSWKMSEGICRLAGQLCLESLPPSGMTRNGVLFPQPRWEPITDATESSSWPTPTAVTRPMEGNVRLYRAKVRAGEMTEEEAEVLLGKSVWEAQGAIPAMWPTPTSSGNTSNRNGQLNNPTLRDAVNSWPTPRAALGDARNHTVYERSMDKPQNLENKVGTADQSAIGGKLNPTWVEWLMGFPTGWTDLED